MSVRRTVGTRQEATETGVTGEPLHSVTLLTFAAREARRLLTPSVVRSFPRLNLRYAPVSSLQSDRRTACMERVRDRNDERRDGRTPVGTKKRSDKRRTTEETGGLQPFQPLVTSVPYRLPSYPFSFPSWPSVGPKAGPRSVGNGRHGM